MRKEQIIAGLAACAVAGGAVEARAQDTSAGTSRDTVEEIVVTARRQEENIQRTPVAVTAYTAADLANRSVPNLAEIKESTPNLNIVAHSTDQFGADVQIRGQLTNNIILTLDPAIGIYVDGVYQGPTAGLALNRLLDIERVEVLKGPQGTLYGRNTTGGAINVYTTEPTYDFGGLVRAGLGRFGQRDVGAVLNLPLAADQAALRIAADISHTDGFGFDERNDRRLGRLTTRYVRAALRMDPGERLSGVIRADYQKGVSGSDIAKPLFLAPGSNAQREIALELFNLPRTAAVTPAQLQAASDYFQALAGGSPFVTQLTRPLRQSFEAAGASATFKYDLGFAELTSITGYRWFNQLREQDVDGTPFVIIQSGVEFPLQARIRQFTQELQLGGEALDGRLKYLVGAYYFRSNGDDNASSTALAVLNPANPATLLGHTTTRSKSVFGQATYAITPAINFTGGLRYTTESKGLEVSAFNPVQGCTIYVPARVGGASGPCLADLRTRSDDVSYTAGFDWTVAEGLFVYAKTSRGYKGGGLNLRVTLSPNSVLPFLPEHVTDYEVGLKSDFFDRRVRLNLAYFHSDYSDIQRSVVVANGQAAASVTQNAASAVIDGVEAEFTATPVRGLRLAANGAYLNPRYRRYLDNGVDQSAQNFQFFSKWSYSLSAAYTIETEPGDLRMQLDWNWRSKIDFSPEAFRVLPDRYREQSAYGLLNGQVAFTFNRQRTRVAVYVRNILDKYYLANINQVVSAGVGNAFALPGVPRTYGLTFSNEF